MAESEGGESTSLLDSLPTDRLKSAAETLLKTLTDKAVEAALEQVEGLTGRLTDVAENGGVGLQSALAGGREAAEGGSPVTGAIKGGLSAAKDKVMDAVGLGGGDDDDDGASGGGGSGGGGRGKFKFMNIVEELDVGVPVRVAYDQWTQFADFPTFMKKVASVEQESDEKTNWKAQVFWSKRTWNATILEQIPDTHIIWRSSGAKGYVNGIVSFHELAPSLTKVLLVMEYYPVGLFEKTGNIWRAVGRRARLEFKHYRRHVMVETLINQEELEGWRGEIRDSEVVKTHEEALEEEQAAADEDRADDEYDDEEPDDYADDEYDEGADDEGADDEGADEAAGDEAAADEAEDDGYLEDVDEAEEDPEPDDEFDERSEDDASGDAEDDDEDEGRPVGNRSKRRSRQTART
ncbi:MAG: SRPBCC family protein [Pseudonocardia sp.]|nr:SRPBCC family protein [Pseudonocardia sp.]